MASGFAIQQVCKWNNNFVNNAFRTDSEIFFIHSFVHSFDPQCVLRQSRSLFQNELKYVELKMKLCFIVWGAELLVTTSPNEVGCTSDIPRDKTFVIVVSLSSITSGY